MEVKLAADVYKNLGFEFKYNTAKMDKKKINK